MQRNCLVHSLKMRFDRPRWIGIGVFLALFALSHVVKTPSLREEGLPHFFYLLAGFAYIYALAPMPWQWTGTEAPQAPLLRGLLQSLAWNGLWLALLVILPLSMGNPATFLGAHELTDFLRTGHATPCGIALQVFGRTLAVACLVGWFIAREEAQRRIREEADRVRTALEDAARRAQAQALQAQLDPHVLYNALSGISELIREDPGRAEEAVVHLSSLYRRLTDAGRRTWIPLAEEKQILGDLLAVEHMRLGSRLRIVWSWPAELDDRRVPPLLVQPLVENAIKHGLAPREQGGTLWISAEELPEGTLRICVMNDGQPLDPGHAMGTGLANLTARLALLGKGSRLDLRQEGDRVLAELHIHPEGRT